MNVDKFEQVSNQEARAQNDFKIHLASPGTRSLMFRVVSAPKSKAGIY